MATMAIGHFYSVVLGIALVIADPFYGLNHSEVGQIVTPANSTAELQGSKEALKALVDGYKRDRDWGLLKSGLTHELNASSPTYRQALNISGDAQYPLEQMSTSADYLDLLNTVLDGGLAPDTIAGPNDWTMLHFSAEHGITPVAELLFRHGANPNVRTSTQDTPIIIAAWRNHLPVVKALNEHGADLNSQNEDGRAALHRAAYWGYADVVKYLVDSCANTTVTTKLGNTLLDDAKNRSYPAIIQMLSQQSSECYMY